MKQAYITVFFSLIFMILSSMIISVFAGIRINAFKLKAECAYSVAANSVLGEYHKELLELYDLFYIDTSYKTAIPDYHQIEAHLWDYVEKNLEISPASVEINQILMATDDKGIAYRKQISAYMKDKIGVSYVEHLLGLWEEVSKEGVLNEDLSIQNKWNNTWQGAMEKGETISEDEWKKIEKYSPIENSYCAKESFVLGQVIEKESSISNKYVNVAEYASSRDCIAGTGSNQELNQMDKIYFVSYLFEKFSCYTSERPTGLLDYEIEYLIGQGGSDYENLCAVSKKLLAFRECMNLTFLLSDSEKMSLIKEIATALSALIFCPELAPVFEVLIIGLWSYIESVNDVKTLFEGGKVPLMKNKSLWGTSLNGGLLLNFSTDESSQGQTGLDYRQYLELFLLFSNNEVITYKSMDLIEMNIRKTGGNENFRLDACAEEFLVNLVFEIEQLGSYQIVRKFGYGI